MPYIEDFVAASKNDCPNLIASDCSLCLSSDKTGDGDEGKKDESHHFQENKIKKNIESAKRRKLPLVKTTLDSYCNIFSVNVMSLLKHQLTTQSLFHDGNESTKSFKQSNTNSYRSQICVNVNKLFKNQGGLKETFIARQELRSYINCGNVSDPSVDDAQDSSASTNNTNEKSSDVSIDEETVFFLIMSNLLQYELNILKRDNDDFLKEIEEKDDDNYAMVSTFLAKLNLSHLFNNFKEARIIPSLFKDLNLKMLSKAGITKPGEQKLILNAAEEYHSKYPESFKCSSVLRLETEVAKINDQKNQIKKENEIKQEEMSKRLKTEVAKMNDQMKQIEKENAIKQEEMSETIAKQNNEINAEKEEKEKMKRDFQKDIMRLREKLKLQEKLREEQEMIAKKAIENEKDIDEICNQYGIKMDDENQEKS